MLQTGNRFKKNCRIRFLTFEKHINHPTRSINYFTMRLSLFLIFFAFGIPAFTQTGPLNGKLIIIGGGDIPDTIYSIFAAHCGGKDQSVVVIPTATGDEEWTGRSLCRNSLA